MACVVQHSSLFPCVSPFHPIGLTVPFLLLHQWGMGELSTQTPDPLFRSSGPSGSKSATFDLRVCEVHNGQPSFFKYRLDEKWNPITKVVWNTQPPPPGATYLQGDAVIYFDDTLAPSLTRCSLSTVRNPCEPPGDGTLQTLTTKSDYTPKPYIWRFHPGDLPPRLSGQRDLPNHISIMPTDFAFEPTEQNLGALYAPFCDRFERADQ